MVLPIYPKIIWPENLDEYDFIEMTAKGYVSLVIEVALGVSNTIYFTDPLRLAQDIAAEIEDGNYPAFAEPGLVVIPRVTRDNIEKAVAYAWKSGYFSYLKANI